ncbi:MAG: alpha/beta fold hydrolase, partial [Nocardioides sp.]
MTGPLAVTSIGAGPPVVFCHGLFGQGKNWTNIAKRLAEAGLPHEGLGEHQIVLPDMPNHGRSPWTDSFDYVAAADAVAEVCRGVAPGAPVSPSAPVAPDAPGSTAPQVSLVGHSMGGKIAMLVALRHPGLIKRLAVVDVAPVAYPFPDSFDAYLTAMRGLDLAALGNRGEADQALAAAVPD